MLHCLQLLPHTPYRDAECKKYLNLHPGQKEAREKMCCRLYSFAVMDAFAVSSCDRG